MKEENKQNGNNGKEENNNSNINNIISKFGIKTIVSTRATINISKLKEIEKELKTGEAIQITDLSEFAKLIDATTTDIMAIRNKIYREYQKGNTNLKPVVRDRFLYLVRK